MSSVDEQQVEQHERTALAARAPRIKMEATINNVTITIDERLLIAICDTALKNQAVGGVQMIQMCGTVLAEIQRAKTQKGPK